MADTTGRYYVYVYRDPRSGDPIYVGKGMGRRSRVHWEWKTHNLMLSRIFARIKQAGLEPICNIDARFDEEKAAFDHESILITQFGRRNLGTGTLCNLTDGGEGTVGRRDTPESIALRALANTGQKRSTEAKAKMSMARLGRKFGPRAPEIGAKISATLKGKEKSTETRAAISAGNIGKVRSEDFKARVSATMTGRERSPEHKEALRQAGIRAWANRKAAEDQIGR